MVGSQYVSRRLLPSVSTDMTNNLPEYLIQSKYVDAGAWTDGHPRILCAVTIYELRKPKYNFEI